MTHYAMGDDDFDQEDSAGGVCLTPDCVKVAANILTSADLNADPCEDFYQGSMVEANDMGHIRTFGFWMQRLLLTLEVYTTSPQRLSLLPQAPFLRLLGC